MKKYKNALPLIFFSLQVFGNGSTWMCHQNTSISKWECWDEQVYENEPEWMDRHRYQAISPFAPLSELDDWVVSEDPDNLCGGYYRDPTALPSASPKISLEADEGSYLNSGNSTLQGNVLVSHGTQAVRADTATVERNNDTGKIKAIHGSGQVQFTEEKYRIRSSDFALNLVDEKSVLGKSSYRIYDRHARGTAEEIAVTKEALLLKNATYTTCAPGKNTWDFQTDRLKLNRTQGRGYASNAKLYVHNVPVFYFPYLNFPINADRQTGFLYPTMGSATNLGTVLSLPFYWNMAPNYDSTWIFSYLSERGAFLETEGRYLLKDKSTGLVQFELLPNDEKYRAFRRESRLNHPGISDTDPQVTALSRGNHRYYAHYLHKGPISNWQSNIDYETVSDDNYFANLGTNLTETSKTYLKQEANFSSQNNWWLTSLLVQNYKTLHPFNGPLNQDPYQRLPEINTRMNAPYPISIFEGNMDGSVTRFYHINPTQVQGTRVVVNPSLSLPYEGGSYSIEPTLKFYQKLYFLGPNAAQPQLAKEKGITIPQFNIDGKVFFEKQFAISQTQYHQTLTPRINYLYIPYRNQNNLPNFDSAEFDFNFYQLFRGNRFSGSDRVGDTHQLTIGATTELTDTLAKIENLNAGIGEIFYFKDRIVTVENTNLAAHRSSYAGYLAYGLGALWAIRTDFEWQPETHNFDKHTASLEFNDNNKKIVNLNYQYIRQDSSKSLGLQTPDNRLKQTIASIAWPLQNEVDILLRWNYDFALHRRIETLYGIEWDSCCTTLRFLVQREFTPNRTGLTDNYNNSYYFQIALKGLSNIGNNRLDKNLSNWIPGWKKDEF